jgi:hypothetical protein
VALALQQLNRTSEESPVPQKALEAAFSQASKSARAQIFTQAQAASADRSSADYEVRNSGAISILRALIALDPKKVDHRNFSELSYALSRQQPPKSAEAEAAITQAIQSRDQSRIKGWRYYEFQRALEKIRQDPKCSQGAVSDPQVAQSILADLDVAFRETTRWPNWLTSHADVAQWITLNAPTHFAAPSSSP